MSQQECQIEEGDSEEGEDEQELDEDGEGMVSFSVRVELTLHFLITYNNNK